MRESWEIRRKKVKNADFQHEEEQLYGNAGEL